MSEAWVGDVRPLITPLQRKLEELSVAERFEQAAVVRDRIASVVRACARMQRHAGLRAIDELVAARPDGSGGWELTVIRRGRLAASGTAPRGVAPIPVVEALLATADAIDDHHDVLAEELDCLLRWLEEPGTRLVRMSSPWAMPAFGAGRMRAYLASGASGSRGADPFADRRRLPIVARPARSSRPTLSA